MQRDAIKPGPAKRHAATFASAAPARGLYRLAESGARRLAIGLALTGTVMLVLLTLLTAASVSGRALTGLGFDQIAGDFELVELGTGFAVFCFLPWAQISGAHARVDLFRHRFSQTANRSLDLAAEIGAAAFAVLILWRLWLGMLDKRSYGETTLILQLPLWQGYLAALAGAVAIVLVSLFCVWRSLRALTAA
ncbi:TRAP transporter small permease [Pseudooceanicola sp. C21-150M6]|uniref:TRAP transporter small permease n=1 Tax=Pseudooceanicola sp. C21-150M6 TaxID=3434355 RepID=UPI003D7FBA16